MIKNEQWSSKTDKSDFISFPLPSPLIVRWPGRHQTQEVKGDKISKLNELSKTHCNENNGGGHSPPSSSKNLMVGRNQIPEPFWGISRKMTVHAGPSVFGSLSHYFPCVLHPPATSQIPLSHDVNLPPPGKHRRGTTRIVLVWPIRKWCNHAFIYHIARYAAFRGSHHTSLHVT